MISAARNLQDKPDARPALIARLTHSRRLQVNRRSEKQRSRNRDFPHQQTPVSVALAGRETAAVRSSPAPSAAAVTFFSSSVSSSE